MGENTRREEEDKVNLDKETKRKWKELPAGEGKEGRKSHEDDGKGMTSENTRTTEKDVNKNTLGRKSRGEELPVGEGSEGRERHEDGGLGTRKGEYQPEKGKEHRKPKRE